MASKQIKYNPALCLRDMREPGWLWIQKELLTVFAAHIGNDACLLYVVLACQCFGNNSEVQISTRELSGEVASGQEHSRGIKSLSRTTVRRSLQILQASGCLLLLEPATRETSAVYGLPSLVKAAACFTLERRQAVAQLRQSMNQRQNLSSQRGPLGPTGIAPFRLRKSPSKSSGKAVEIYESSTEVPGPPVGPCGPRGWAPAGAQYKDFYIKQSATQVKPVLCQEKQRARKAKTSQSALRRAKPARSGGSRA
jgi:hypothetical protein